MDFEMGIDQWFPSADQGTPSSYHSYIFACHYEFHPGAKARHKQFLCFRVQCLSSPTPTPSPQYFHPRNEL